MPYDPGLVLRAALSPLQKEADANGLDLVVDTAQLRPGIFINDASRLRQVLRHLVGNAVKFTERGEVVIRALGRPAGDGLGTPHILLEIEDSGIGIPRRMLEAIFDSFSQADESTTRRYGGTGLGTTIARDLTLLMGGRIDVASEEGVGTRFSVRLPLPDATEALPHGGVEPADPALRGKRVVVYERNSELRQLIAETCRGHGMICFAERDFARVSEDLRNAGSAELLIVADSPQRIDIHAMICGFKRLLDGEVPCLLLLYSQRRTELGDLGCRRLNKPFQRSELLAAIRAVLATPAAAPALPATAAAPASAAPARTVAGTRVLVAEDNAIAARVITTMLRKQGAEVTLVGDGNEALAAAAAEPFDVAFIDLRMPGLDGLDFTRRLRAREGANRHLNIIALTANAAEDVREECLAAGMDAFLTKPVDPAALIEAAQRFGVGEPG
jgi:two-component system sensor histidine kinase RpfC